MDVPPPAPLSIILVSVEGHKGLCFPDSLIWEGGIKNIFYSHNPPI